MAFDFGAARRVKLAVVVCRQRFLVWALSHRFTISSRQIRFQFFPQGGSRPIEARFNGSLRQFEDLGDFLIRQMFQFSQQDDLPMIRGQFRESGVEVDFRFDARRAIRRRRLRFRQGRRGAFLPPKSRRLDHQDSRQPGFDRRATFESAQSAERADERFLQNVFGVRTIPDQCDGEPKEPVGVAIDQRVERSCVPARGFGEKVRIFHVTCVVARQVRFLPEGVPGSLGGIPLFRP